MATTRQHVGLERQMTYTLVNKMAEEVGTLAMPMERVANGVGAAWGEEVKEKEEEEEEEWEYLDETDVYLRSKFYESWLWMDVKLPGQADRDG